MTADEALTLLLADPARVANLCGYSKLTSSLHGRWMKDMLLGQKDMTLMAHRGSYKTTCLAMVMATLLVTRPGCSLMFLRKTDEDAAEIIKQVKMILQTEAMRTLTAAIYGESVTLCRTGSSEITTNVYCAPRGAAQLIGCGLGGTLTGRHAEYVFTDDIVTLRDRISQPERERTAAVYMELQNIRSPGGRIINTGTPWHREDAFRLMPAPQKFDCYTTGLLGKDEIHRLHQSMSPSLFAANYELRHIAREDALFASAPAFTADETQLYGGIAHVDAGYGGGDMTALTCARRTGDSITLYGRLWQGHVDTCMEAIAAECDRLQCGPLWCETNGDKGYLARELRRRGMQVRAYRESANKYVKIATHLRKWWHRITFLEGTDSDYLAQILDYSDCAIHDDAPDSAACICRLLERRE
ncbi:MAG: hypothetical protein Q4C54_03895 [Clostridia bacterium]|nr:hypothetical protein [Clostridia bacterium]